MPRSTWFCIDIECSGPVPALFDMLSLGVVRVLRSPNGWDISEPYYIEFCPTAPHVDTQAMAVNGLSLERLRQEGLALSVGLEKLTTWVNAHTEEDSTPVFVGHNAPFDWSFVSYGYCASGLKNPFGYKALDTKALAMGILGVHWLDSNKEILEEKLDLPVVDHSKVHRADYDAWFQAHILAQLLTQMEGTCVDL